MLFSTWKPPLEPQLLQDVDFFLLYPFDGGGRFIQQEMLGTLDDREICRRIMQEGALADFGDFPNLDFRKFERWSTIEKDSWINRMYFTASLGHAYALTGDQAIAHGLKDLILGFARRYPAPQGQDAVELERRVIYARDNDYNAKGADFDDETEYIWFDFQPASRIVNILNACWFLRDTDVFSDDEKEELRQMLLTHVRNIYVKERDFYKPGGDNHQSLRSVALLYGCEFFKDTLPEETKQWLEVAAPLCQTHLLADRLPDGMGNDLSPSYHFFVTWITRDMLILAERLGLHFSDEALAQARKSFDICRLLRQPDGFSTVISDGYPLQMDAFLKALPPATTTPAKTTLLPVSRLGIQHDGNAFLLFDCSPLLSQLAHFHGGKQALTLFLAGQCVLADSGCCNYDDPRFAQHFKQPSAHSSLLLDGQGDSFIQGRYKWLKAPECRLSQQGDSLTSVMTSPMENWQGVTWERTVCLESETAAHITDKVDNPLGRFAIFPLILHPHIRIVECSEHEVTLEGKNGLRFGGRSRLPWRPAPGLGYLPFQCVPCQTLEIGGNAKQLENRIDFFLLNA